MKTYINACTTGSNFAAEISEELTKKGIATLEAPISGGPPGARDGTLSIMASGPSKVYEEVKPILESYGKKLVFCGCLLYTSPSPRDKRQSRMPSSA